MAEFRVLVVEDEPLIAMEVEDAISDLGFSVARSVARLDEAMAEARGGAFDGVVLDLHIHGGNTLPVAELLAGRGIPFVLVSGDGVAGRAELTDLRLGKPFTQEQLKTKLLELSRRQPGHDTAPSMASQG